MNRAPLIITFADSGYLPLLQIWLANLELFGVSRVRVYCLDEQIQAWCEARGIDASRLLWNGDLRDLWVRRIGVFRELLAAGEEVIHSDTDAIWVRDPLRVGSACELTDDLIFSQGTVWPPDIHSVWGFVLCCGWFWARPTLAAQAFFRGLETDVKATGDDQISVNRQLAAAGARWLCRGVGDYQLPFRDRTMQCWLQPIRATALVGVESADAGLAPTPLSVALLPHREFQRLPEASDRAIVKHYLTPKNCAQKLEFFRRFGLISS